MGLFLSFSSFAQDIQFSQFYNVPLYQNPAFAGSAHRLRTTLHQRLQWPGLSARYITTLVSVDNYFTKYNSGVGLMVLKDWQGGSTINSLDVSLQYSYEIHLSSDFTLRAGLSGSFVQRSINYAKLMFPSQFDDTIGYIGGPSPVSGNQGNLIYPDIATGGILYTDNYWLGVSAHHLNIPNQSFIENSSRLPVKLAFTGGYKIKLEEERHAAYMDEGREVSIIPTFHYKFQGKSDQFDLGVYGIY
ncbi:MAG: type IX secretion system membrane protein PorP/SprF, partial [Cytophagaceae bacterium]|nr:type IX secretion system membrane protein PorP/SprF [Cytophagaceae bacterium]